MEEYREGRAEIACKYLGHVVHLVSDMASPAHTHNDPHMFESGYDHDSIEAFVESNFSRYRVPDQYQYRITNFATDRDLMYGLNQRASWFPSNDVEGNDLGDGYSHPDWHKGWPLADGVDWPHFQNSELYDSNKLDEISKIVVPLAIRNVADLYVHFMKQFKPVIEASAWYPTVLQQVNIQGFGTPEGYEFSDWEWDLDYDGVDFDVDQIGPTISTIFKQAGEKTIALRASAPGHDPLISTEKIFVRPYPIGIFTPDGYRALVRKFSTPFSSLIAKYEWGYGDGTPVETGRTKSHTYTASDYYTVKLYLTLKDGSTLQSEKGIFVGPGKRYIQGHTIYGDETWYSGGTYVVLGGITVAPGAILTIQPGVKVQLSAGTQMVIHGTLTATGVTFTWADGENQWGGILIQGTGSSGSRLENCAFEHATGWAYYGVIGIISIESSSPTISGCTITGSTSTYGIWLRSASPLITEHHHGKERLWDICRQLLIAHCNGKHDSRQ